jgi:hypothetical protein
MPAARISKTEAKKRFPAFVFRSMPFQPALFLRNFPVGQKRLQKMQTGSSQRYYYRFCLKESQVFASAPRPAVLYALVLRIILSAQLNIKAGNKLASKK